MARTSIDDKERNDPRIRVAAVKAGVSRFDIIGRIDALVAHCTDLQVYGLPEHLVDALVELPGFAAILCDEQIAFGKRNGDGFVELVFLYGKIEWLSKKREAAKLGGAARAKAPRAPNGRLQGNQSPAIGQPGASHLAGEWVPEGQPNSSPTTTAMATVSSISKKEKKSAVRSRPDPDVIHPYNPNAKELAAKYAPICLGGRAASDTSGEGA